jgi:hypothetical protein
MGPCAVFDDHCVWRRIFTERRDRGPPAIDVELGTLGF